MAGSNKHKRSLLLRDHFDSAHFLKNYEGKCANMHGHTYNVEIEVTAYGIYARDLNIDNAGMLMDFGILKAHLKEILDGLDHKILNECEIFEGMNPTAEIISEKIAVAMYRAINKDMKALHERYARGCSPFTVKATVWETPNNAATYEVDSY